MRDTDGAPVLPEGWRERLAAGRPWPRPASYAVVLPRLVRGEPALPRDRRRRARVLAGWSDGLRGRLVDLLS